MTETTISTTPAFRGKLLKVDVLEVELPDGQVATREIVRHPGAAVILCELPDGRFVFVRQYRKAIEQELLEVVAGTLDPGETPEACALREVQEETGYRCASITHLGAAYPAPGYTEEKLHFFHAMLDPEQGEQAPDDDEFVEPVILTRQVIVEMITSGQLEDAKSLTAWMLYTSCARGKDEG